MCKMYGKKLGIMFFYEQGQSSLHLHKLYDKFMDVIFFYEADALCSDGTLSQRHLKTNQLTIVWSNTPVETVI